MYDPPVQYAPGAGGPWSALVARVAGLTPDPGAPGGGRGRPGLAPLVPAHLGSNLSSNVLQLQKSQQAPVCPGQAATHRMRPSLVASPAFLLKPDNIAQPAHSGQGLLILLRVSRASGQGRC